MTDTIKILLSFVVIVFTNILGHYFPPTSIMLSPVTIGLVTGLLVSTTFKLFIKILLIALAIMANDIFIKKYAGGTHDSEGAGFINFFLIIGLIISIILIIEKTISNKRLRITNKIALILLLPTIMFLYLLYFGSYGLSFPKPMCSTKEKATENKTFISDLNFSSQDIIYDSDSFHIISGWAEKELIINHTSLLRKTYETENINYKIKIKHNFEPYTFPIYYKVNSDKIIGARPIDSVLEFRAKKLENITLTFFKIRNGSFNKDTIIKRVTIKRT